MAKKITKREADIQRTVDKRSFLTVLDVAVADAFRGIVIQQDKKRVVGVLVGLQNKSENLIDLPVCKLDTHGSVDILDAKQGDQKLLRRSYDLIILSHYHEDLNRILEIALRRLPVDAPIAGGGKVSITSTGAYINQLSDDDDDMDIDVGAGDEKSILKACIGLIVTSKLPETETKS